jgi:outer membrane protein OmpA-like peptidoglycan-associated protein
MWKPRPEKWLLRAVPMVGLTTFAAYVLNTGPLNRDISTRATEQLFAIGANWAVPSFNGRDITIGGDAPSQEAIDSAVEALSDVYGVRTVATGARVVAGPPVSLIAPTTDSLTSNNATPEIFGTWQEGLAKTLAVTLADRTFTFGTDPELTSNAGKWMLKPSVPLADGSYDVAAAVSDGINPAIGNTEPAKITIDTVAPPAPAITPLASGIQWPFTLNGTWAEGEASALVAKVADQTWTLGKDEDLKTDGKGNWSFAPIVDLAPGSYDITVEAVDQAGNTAKSTLAGAIIVLEPVTPAEVAIPAPIAQPTTVSASAEVSIAPVPAAVPEVANPAPIAEPPAVPATPEVAATPDPIVLPEVALAPAPAVSAQSQPVAATPSPPPYDCVGVLEKVSTVFPIRFDFNDTKLKPPLDVAMNQYAALLKDIRCVAMKAEVAGHTDFLGPRLFNQALSEARAEAVVKALAAAGVDASRLTTKGFSELMPADQEKSVAARMKNRRVEITLVE